MSGLFPNASNDPRCAIRGFNDADHHGIATGQLLRRH